MPLMPKSKYKLQVVLDVRERAKQDAARRVATRRAELAEAEAELSRRRQAVDDCRGRQRAAQEKLIEKLAEGADVGHVVTHRTHLADLRQLEQELLRRVEQQCTAVARAEHDVETALGLLGEASQELQVIEKHREEWQAQKLLDDQRRAQKLSDEISSIIHERRRDK